jgi:hypothetical protein
MDKSDITETDHEAGFHFLLRLDGRPALCAVSARLGRP